MISLATPVAAGRSVLVYADADDPGVLHYMPRFAEPCLDEDGEVKVEQRTFRPPGAGGGVSAYNLAVRAVVPPDELAALAGELGEAHGRAVTLAAAPVWPNSPVGVALLTAGAWTPLAARARALQPDFAEIFVMLAVGAGGEPALAERFQSPDGVAIGLEFRVTGATAPFRGSLRADFGAVQRRLRARFPHGPVSREEISAEVEALLAAGAIRLRAASAAVPPERRVAAATRVVIDRLMRLDRAPPRPTPFPSLHGAWFRHREETEPGRRERVEMNEPGLETRALAMTAYVAAVPADAFCGLDGAFEEVTPALARGFARQGIPIG